MSTPLKPTALNRLDNEKNIWLASVRPDERPHLVPVWFAWYETKVYICIQEKSVKASNMKQNPRVSIALEDGSKVVIGEGNATFLAPPWSQAVANIFAAKYNWDIHTDKDYDALLEIQVEKWLNW